MNSSIIYKYYQILVQVIHQYQFTNMNNLNEGHLGGILTPTLQITIDGKFL